MVPLSASSLHQHAAQQAERIAARCLARKKTVAASECRRKKSSCHSFGGGLQAATGIAGLSDDIHAAANIEDDSHQFTAS